MLERRGLEIQHQGPSLACYSFHGSSIRIFPICGCLKLPIAILGGWLRERSSEYPQATFRNTEHSKSPDQSRARDFQNS